MDCQELLAELPAECIDLVVSSPPYNIGKKYESRRPLDVYLEEQALILKECHRVLKSTGSLFWQVGSFSDNGSIIPLDIKMFPILESLGMIPRNRIIWVRQHGLHGQHKFSCRHETILWFTKSNEYTFSLQDIRVPQKYPDKKHFKGDRKGKLSCNPDGKNPGDIWAFQNVKHNHEEQTAHPCQFPEDLIARIILATTKPGDIVLDPYLGAGTVAVVSKNHGRHFVGSELQPDYCQIIQRRLSGEPDADGGFPNLKTLRAYVERTGNPIGDYHFDVQVGKCPSEHSKNFSEEHHLTELEETLAYEEDSFSARLAGDIPPRPRRKAARDLLESQKDEGFSWFSDPEKA